MNDQLPSMYLDFTRLQFCVNRLLTPQTDFTSYLNNGFRFKIVEAPDVAPIVRIKNDLSQSFAITQIDKQNAAWSRTESTHPISVTVAPLSDFVSSLQWCVLFKSQMARSGHRIDHSHRRLRARDCGILPQRIDHH